jgi:hypothetical protein
MKMVCTGGRRFQMPNKRLQPTLGNPRAAEARRWASI